MIGCETASSIEYNSKRNKYEVYPNPVNSVLMVEMEILEEKEYRIYSMVGELVVSGMMNANINTIDLSMLPANIYMLNIDNHSIKLIKTE